ncbi:unnamed protein product [Haemonchus placei]|uniref:EAL domain-containing protein n=1 Tax=Haemonchus placei TaxID=6290 RepID=A0A0N4X001_HAEPC|nr:unnamed protein product [Haemonchus placei]
MTKEVSNELSEQTQLFYPTSGFDETTSCSGLIRPVLEENETSVMYPVLAKAPLGEGQVVGYL